MPSSVTEVQRRATTSASEPRQVARSVRALRRLFELPEVDPIDQIVSCWETIVGSQLASSCRAELVRGGALVIVVDQAALAEQLRWTSSGLIERANGVLGQALIDRITIRNRPY